MKTCGLQTNRICSNDHNWACCPQRGRSHVVVAATNIATEMVQLERSSLSDLSTEELELQLRKHGISLPSKPAPGKKQQAVRQPHQQMHAEPPSRQQHELQQQQQRQRQHLHDNLHQQQSQQHERHHPQQLDAPASQQVQHQQQQQHKQQHQPGGTRQQGGQQQQQQVLKARSRRVAAAAARRALLLEKLATARVQARSKIVRLPLRLSIAGRAKSRRYLTLPVDVEGAGFVDFLLDSSSYLSRITPGMRDKLGIGPADGVAILTGNGNGSSSGGSGIGSSSRSSSGGAISGIGSSNAGSSKGSGSRTRVRLRQRVQLPKMWLGTAQLPPQQAYVTPLQLPPRQQQFRPAGSTGGGLQRMAAAAGAVGGVLGVQVLREFEVDIDFGGNSVALHPPGHVELGLCGTRGMVEIPLRLTKTGALIIPVSLAGSPPFTGLLDLSAASSMLNWEAAALLGMTCQLSEEEDEEDGNDPCSRSRSSSSSVGPPTLPPRQREQQHQQQKQQQQQQRRQQPAAVQHAGKFGSLEVVPSDHLLLKPRLPGPDNPFFNKTPSSSSSNSKSGLSDWHLLPPLPPKLPQQRSHSSSSSSAGSTSSSSSNSNGYSYTPLSGSSIVQKHQVAASQVQLVLGHVRLAAAAAAAAAAATAATASSAQGASGSKSSSSSGSTVDSSSSSGGGGGTAAGLPASLSLPPPSRFGVAGLTAVDQLGLGGQPVMVVGWDVWARQRAVLCLKAGKLYLSAAAGAGGAAGGGGGGAAPPPPGPTPSTPASTA